MSYARASRKTPWVLNTRPETLSNDVRQDRLKQFEIWMGPFCYSHSIHFKIRIKF